MTLRSLSRRLLPAAAAVHVGSFAGCADPTDDSGDEDVVIEQVIPRGTEAGDVSLASAARVSAGSGVYVGGRTMLTNWHVCTDAGSLVLHNDPGTGAMLHREGAACRVRPSGSCNPGVTIRFDGTAPRAPGLVGQAVFMSRAVDLCIIELDPRAAPPALEPLTIDTGEVPVGREVVVASYPGGSASRVDERCRVTKGLAPVRDPDRVNPSDLVVQSFEIDCVTVRHGSSGAPVFDAETGDLLGLVWTGVCTRTGRSSSCGGQVYVTAATAWRDAHAARPPSHYSRLDALLRTYAAP